MDAALCLAVLSAVWAVMGQDECHGFARFMGLFEKSENVFSCWGGPHFGCFFFCVKLGFSG